MTGSIEDCSVCSLTEENLKKGQGEQWCVALHTSEDFKSNAPDCLAVQILNNLGEEIGTIGALLERFPELQRKRP